MYIMIDSKDALNVFSKKVASETQLSPSRLKGAIARAYNFNHITPFEMALSANTQISFDALTIKEKEQNIKGALFLTNEQVIDAACTLVEANDPSELSPTDYERSEDSVLLNVDELLSHDELPRALAIIEMAGLQSLSELLKATLTDAQINNYLQENA